MVILPQEGSHPSYCIEVLHSETKLACICFGHLSSQVSATVFLHPPDKQGLEVKQCKNLLYLYSLSGAHAWTKDVGGNHLDPGRGLSIKQACVVAAHASIVDLRNGFLNQHRVKSPKSSKHKGQSDVAPKKGALWIGHLLLIISMVIASENRKSHQDVYACTRPPLDDYAWQCYDFSFLQNRRSSHGQDIHTHLGVFFNDLYEHKASSTAEPHARKPPRNVECKLEKESPHTPYVDQSHELRGKDCESHLEFGTVQSRSQEPQAVIYLGDVTHHWKEISYRNSQADQILLQSF